MLAKISPTSPRGIIPIPTAHRLTVLSRTPREQSCFPAMAATVSRRASRSASVEANAVRSTLDPIWTKKTGARRSTRGRRPSWSW